VDTIRPQRNRTTEKHRGETNMGSRLQVQLEEAGSSRQSRPVAYASQGIRRHFKEVIQTAGSHLEVDEKNRCTRLECSCLHKSVSVPRGQNRVRCWQVASCRSDSTACIQIDLELFQFQSFCRPCTTAWRARAWLQELGAIGVRDNLSRVGFNWSRYAQMDR